MANTVMPKSVATRERRNRPTTAATIEAPIAKMPPLPDRRWHALASQTWAVWWASPIAAEWVDADVPGLIETLTLVDDFWQAETAVERAKLRAEIRMSSREYGLSSFSRRQLQWEVKRIEEQRPTAPVTPTRQRDPRLRAVG